MLMLVSPAKSLDYETPVPVPDHTQADFLADAALLIAGLRTLSPAQIAQLMDISDQLAALNFGRYADWTLPFTPANARPAVFAFDGDVYAGLDAYTLDAAALAWAQRHLRILSGLYGLLRPLDLIQAYRLEMGSKFANARGKDLYAFWGERLAAAICGELAGDVTPVVVNLASEEYFKAVGAKKLGVRVVQPVFEDWKGRYKVISFYAKRARGLMVRYAIERRIDDPEELKSFTCEDYAFVPAASDAATWVFRRRQE
jgi:uncharacterized protein